MGWGKKGGGARLLVAVDWDGGLGVIVGGGGEGW